MESKLSKRTISQIYLWIVPILVVIFGFNLGKISYTYYVPIWLINVVLMVIASWVLGVNVISHKSKSRHIAIGAFCLIVPTIIVSMFFGLGPPPSTAIDWVETSIEQQVRYAMLTIAGIFIVFGFALLKEKLKSEGENYYSILGAIAVTIAIPLFVLNMLFWGFSLTESCKILVLTNSEKMPEWFRPIRVLFGMIAVVEVALTYLATAFFAVSLNLTRRLRTTSKNIYVSISLCAFLVLTLSVFLPEPFITAGYAVSIPAIPFFMPYYIGVHLLKLEGN